MFGAHDEADALDQAAAALERLATNEDHDGLDPIRLNMLFPDRTTTKNLAIEGFRRPESRTEFLSRIRTSAVLAAAA